MIDHVTANVGDFEQAKRFWFKAQMHFASGLFTQTGDVFDALKNIFLDGAKLIGRFYKFLK